MLRIKKITYKLIPNSNAYESQWKQRIVKVAPSENWIDTESIFRYIEIQTNRIHSSSYLKTYLLSCNFCCFKQNNNV